MLVLQLLLQSILASKLAERCATTRPEIITMYVIDPRLLEYFWHLYSLICGHSNADCVLNPVYNG